MADITQTNQLNADDFWAEDCYAESTFCPSDFKLTPAYSRGKYKAQRLQRLKREFKSLKQSQSQNILPKPIAEPGLQPLDQA